MKVSKAFSITSLVLAIMAFCLATQITIEKLDLLKNPKYIPSCSINPFVSCGPILKSWQSSVLFGFPNSIIGMVGFGIVIVITLSSLFATFPKWYWKAYAVGVSAAMGFLVWLMSQSFFSIHALCLYCMGVWTVTIPLFWFAVGNAVQDTRFGFVNNFKPLLIGLSYVAVAASIFFAFMDQWLKLWGIA